MLHITETQTRILEALGMYKLLTPSQLERVGVSTSRQVIWRELRKLAPKESTNRALVGSIRFSVRMRMEHVETFYYLTPRGARLLTELHEGADQAIEYLRNPTIFHRDYWHRKYCIDFHICLIQALQHEPLSLSVALWERYFDNAHTRGRFQAKTRVKLRDKVLIPDMNFMIEDTRNRQALFCLEMTRGRDIKRMLGKIAVHAAAVQAGAIGSKYGLDQNHQTLFVFEEPSAFDSFCAQFEEVCPPGLGNLFWCGTLADVLGDPLSSWCRPALPQSSRNFITGAQRDEG